MKKVIIVGAGPAGVKAANSLLEQSQNDGLDIAISVFNGEAEKPYHRARLSYYLAGDFPRSDLDNLLVEDEQRLSYHQSTKITELCLEDRCVVDEYGHKHSYDKLILATGSSVLTPNISGANKTGVFTFRSMEDAQALIQRRDKHDQVFVVGSGPLGIETALAMKTVHNTVYLQVRRHLFTNLLDDTAKSVLADYMRSMGIVIVDQATVESIGGQDFVRNVALTNGQTIDVDTIVMCTGIAPLHQLASKAGLEVANGVVVNEYMQSSHPEVYAVGECAEYQGQTQGLVNPGYEQALVCVKHVLSDFGAGDAEAYQLADTELQFKFRNFSSQVVGNIDAEGADVYIYKNALKNVYRRLVVRQRRIQGAVLIGNWDETGTVLARIQDQRKVNTKRLNSFVNTGNIWVKDDVPLTEQPAEYIVCLCQSVTRGEISACMQRGHRSIDALGDELQAGVTCGSCQPLLRKMLDQPVQHLIMRHYKEIFIASIVSVIIIALTAFAPKLPFDRSVQFAFQFEQIWYGSLYKHWTGYLLLAFIALSGALSFRKRWKRLAIGNLDNWRYAHTLLGLVCLVALIVHTGFRLGDNLSLALMVVFLLATLTGSLVGVFMSRNHHWTDVKLTQYRAWWSRVHYGLLWLLPSLLCFHILSSYYFA